MTKKEYKIIINTGSRKEGSIGFEPEFSEFETNIINGHLDGLIIDSDEQVSVTITSELGYLIFHSAQHKGINYYAPRALLQGAISNIIVQDQFEKFNLNERLNIRVSGPTDTNVKIILRID